MAPSLTPSADERTTCAGEERGGGGQGRQGEEGEERGEKGTWHDAQRNSVTTPYTIVNHQGSILRFRGLPKTTDPLVIGLGRAGLIHPIMATRKIHPVRLCDGAYTCPGRNMC